MLDILFDFNVQEIIILVYENFYKFYFGFSFGFDIICWMYFVIIWEGICVFIYVNGCLAQKVFCCSGVDIFNLVFFFFGNSFCV